MRYQLDAAGTDVRLRTRAVGMLSALAHDLELQAVDARGTAEGRESGSVQLEFPVRAVRVVGVVRKGHVTTSVLSPNDVAEIERKLRDEVLATPAVTVAGKYAADRAELVVRGLRASETITAVFDRTGGDDAMTVRGRCTLHLSRLGVDDVKGPMGAFRVADALEVTFTARFVAAPA